MAMAEDTHPPEGETPESGEEEKGTPGPPPLPESKAEEPAEPAVFPKGFWKSVEYLLHHPAETLESLRRDADLWRLSRIFVAISIVMAAIYGMVMGATNLLQGSEMALHAKLLMVLISAVKVPVLFLLTLFIVLPPLYVSNAFVGSRLSFRQIVGFLMAACAVTATVLASMATVAFFFSLTSRSYEFIKLLHVVFFAYAGLTGIGYLVRCFGRVARAAGRPLHGRILVAWLLLYMFVGTQLAWVLRPFVGSPGKEFQVFREREGNFYESVLRSVGNFIDEQID